MAGIRNSAARVGSVPLDRETVSRPGDHAALKVWLRLLTCSMLIEGRIRGFLREHYETTLPRFDLMSQLDRYPAGLRMNELSERMMVTGANVTGITDQLEREGLAQRNIPAGDRRSFIVKLTPQGKRVFAGMAKFHEDWIQRIFSELSSEQMRDLHELLATLKRSTLNLGAEKVTEIKARSRSSANSKAATGRKGKS